MDKWYLKCIELHLTELLSKHINPHIGGACRGSSVANSIAYVNTSISQAFLWGVGLVTTKVDFKRMVASVTYQQLQQTLQYFCVPAEWQHIVLAQVAANVFQIKAVRGEVFHVDLQRGLVEGSPMSVLLIALLLSHFLLLLHDDPRYAEFKVTLPGDSAQPPITLAETGWIDDWVLQADSTSAMTGLLGLWQEVLGGFGWRLNPGKTQFLCTNVFPEPIYFEGCKLEPSDSFRWLGCIVTTSGVVHEHLEHRISLTLAAWQILNRQFCFKQLRFGVKARLYKQILEPILLHGLQAYAMTSFDLHRISRTQNIVQRTFISSSFEEAHARWVDLHARLKDLRSKRRLSDSVLVLLAKYKSTKYSQDTLELVHYKGRAWKSQSTRGTGDRRRAGRPALSLECMLADAGELLLRMSPVPEPRSARLNSSV